MTGNDLVRSNGSGAERRATMPNRRSRTAGAQRVRSSDWLAGQPLAALLQSFDHATLKELTPLFTRVRRLVPIRPVMGQLPQELIL